MSDRPSACSSAPLIAVMLMGVFCTVDSRFSAVTTISCNSCSGPAAVSAPAGSAHAVAQNAHDPTNAALMAARSRRAAGVPPGNEDRVVVI
jgi:hypothetical protein